MPCLPSPAAVGQGGIALLLLPPVTAPQFAANLQYSPSNFSQSAATLANKLCFQGDDLNSVITEDPISNANCRPQCFACPRATISLLNPVPPVLRHLEQQAQKHRQSPSPLDPWCESALHSEPSSRNTRTRLPCRPATLFHCGSEMR